MAIYNDQTQVLVEILEDKFAALTELVVDMREQMITKAELAEELRPIRQDLHALKATLTVHSYDLNDHERRIACLETTRVDQHKEL